MKTLSQNESNDVFVRDGSIALSDGVKAYGEIVADAIRTIIGEIQLDVNIGIPYFETVFKSVNGIDIWKNDVRKRVLEFPFVKSIESFEVDYSNRILKYALTFATDLGVVEISS